VDEARREGLAGAVLAEDEDRGVGRGDGVDPFADRLRRRGRGDQGVGVVVALDEPRDDLLAAQRVERAAVAL
jgi:hypothetical protein